LTPQSSKKHSKSLSASLSSGSGSSKVVSNGLPRSADVNNSHRTSSPLDNSFSSANAIQSTPISRLSSVPAATVPSTGKKSTTALHNPEVVQPVGVSVNHCSGAETPALSHSAKVL